jgi:hypothetical protein
MYENPLVGDDSEVTGEGEGASPAGKQAGKLSHEQEQKQKQRSAIGPEDSYVLHFYDLSARKPHTMYKFMR